MEFKFQDRSLMQKRLIELSRVPDLEAVVAGAAILEGTLKEMVQSRLREGIDAKEIKMLFAAEGALGGFTRQAKLSRALGWIGATTAQNLYQIATIRNYFAHNALASFDDKKIDEPHHLLKFDKDTILGEVVVALKGTTEHASEANYPEESIVVTDANSNVGAWMIFDPDIADKPRRDQYLQAVAGSWLVLAGLINS